MSGAVEQKPLVAHLNEKIQTSAGEAIIEKVIVYPDEAIFFGGSGEVNYGTAGDRGDEETLGTADAEQFFRKGIDTLINRIILEELPQMERDDEKIAIRNAGACSGLDWAAGNPCPALTRI